MEKNSSDFWKFVKNKKYMGKNSSKQKMYRNIRQNENKAYIVKKKYMHQKKKIIEKYYKKSNYDKNCIYVK